MKREIQCLFQLAEGDLEPWNSNSERAKDELQQILDSPDATEDDKKHARSLMHQAIDMAAEEKYGIKI